MSLVSPIDRNQAVPACVMAERPGESSASRVDPSRRPMISLTMPKLPEMLKNAERYSRRASAPDCLHAAVGVDRLLPPAAGDPRAS